MRKESYLGLLILFYIVSQGNAIISNKRIANSSDTHIRNKRVINNSAGGVQPAHITLSRHLVQILVADTFECAGIILQPNIIVTVRTCLFGSDDQYTVLSDSLTKGRGTHHRAIETIKHHNFNIALLKIHPPIILSPRGNQKIDLFTGILPQGAVGLFSGWGCTNISPQGIRTYPSQLMATLLPIMNYRECYEVTKAFKKHIPLPINICTLDRRRERGGCFGDEGGSLVYENRLVGIFSTIREVNLGVTPDLFINIAHEDMGPWITIKTNQLLRSRKRT